MKEYLPFVTIDVWTLIFTWGNLIILFLIMKKFLFGPVKRIIDAREKEVNGMLDKAARDMKNAEEMKVEYIEKLDAARAEADTILKSAMRNARLKEEEILKDAHNEAANVIARAENQIELEKKKAFEDVKCEVSEMAVSIASKVIEKDISKSEHEEIIDKFINGMGEIK